MIKILNDIVIERERQECLKSQGKFVFSCADEGMNNFERFAVLVEEVGEVGHELNDTIGTPDKPSRMLLRSELIQVAAVCVAWVEHLDKRTSDTRP